jgi:hypothetical protein
MEMNVDRQAKRCIANIYKYMVFHLSGLSSSPQNNTILSRKSNGSPQSMDANGTP